MDFSRRGLEARRAGRHPWWKLAQRIAGFKPFADWALATLDRAERAEWQLEMQKRVTADWREIAEEAEKKVGRADEMVMFMLPRILALCEEIRKVADGEE